MVKGISRQVILVHSPDRKLFEEAIFILREDAVGEGISDEALLREAERAVQEHSPRPRGTLYLYGAFWACIGAAATGLVWLLTAVM